MKLVRFTKEIVYGEFKAIIKKLSAENMMDIQKKAVKFKDTAIGVEITKENAMQYTETDTKAYRLSSVLSSIIKWNLEDDTSTDENPIYLPITEETIKSDIFPNELFVFIEKEVNEYNNPKKVDIKN